MAGVFIMLGCGFVVGVIILICEHLVFKYSLPSLRKMPKECFWKVRDKRIVKITLECSRQLQTEAANISRIL